MRKFLNSLLSSKLLHMSFVSFFVLSLKVREGSLCYAILFYKKELRHSHSHVVVVEPGSHRITWCIHYFVCIYKKHDVCFISTSSHLGCTIIFSFMWKVKTFWIYERTCEFEKNEKKEYKNILIFDIYWMNVRSKRSVKVV